MEPEADMNDPKRIEALVCLGFNRYDIENSLDSQKYDDAYATYLLLGRKCVDVSTNHLNDWPTDKINIFIAWKWWK